MNNPTFYIVDVFAEKKYAGNQLAVIRGADDLSDGEMQSIATEMNYSDMSFKRYNASSISSPKAFRAPFSSSNSFSKVVRATSISVSR